MTNKYFRTATALLASFFAVSPAWSADSAEVPAEERERLAELFADAMLGRLLDAIAAVVIGGASLFGGSGNDLIDGGEGADIQMGGADRDVFIAAVRALGSNSRSWTAFLKREAELRDLLHD